MAQEHRLNRGVVQELLQRLQQAFGEEALRHVILPSNSKIKEADFFRCLWQRFGLPEVVTNSFELEQGLLDIIDPYQPAYWLITGLERCN